MSKRSNFNDTSSLRLARLIGVIASIFYVLSHPLRAEENRIIRSSDMIGLIGVNTHMNYNDGAYANMGNVLKDLKFLGVNHIRDVVPGTDSQPHLQARDELRRMIHENIKLNMLFTSGWTPISLVWVRSLEASAPGAIASIEGYNEINNFPVVFEGLKGPAAAKAGQKALYDAVKSDPVLNHVPVLDMTGFEMISDPTFSYGTSLAGYADIINTHPYPQNGAPPGIWISSERPSLSKNAASLPIQATEFGYATRPETNWGFVGVDELAQAKGVLNGLFDAARAGYDRVYIYELLDEKPDPALRLMEFHFGLFTFDNEPKSAAVAIKNLTTILADTHGAGNGGSPAPLPSPIKVRTDEPDDNVPVRSIVIMHEDGTPFVAVWRETPFWDRATARSLDAPSIKVTIFFGRACGSIRTYDPLRSSGPVSVSAGDSIALPVVDHVQLVECALRDRG